MSGIAMKRLELLDDILGELRGDISRIVTLAQTDGLEGEELERFRLRAQRSNREVLSVLRNLRDSSK